MYPESPIDSVRDYLAEIGTIPLLTYEQEVEFGLLVMRRQEIKRVAEALANELDRSPTSQEIADKMGMSAFELDKAIKRGDRAARRIVKSNLRLVVSIAKKYQNRGIPFQDLIQEGSIGLMRAAEKFDPTKGWKFSTYAYWWIRQGITRAIAGNARVVRLPIHITEKLNKLKNARRQFFQAHLRQPTMQELTAILDMEMPALQALRKIEPPAMSLDLTFGEEDDVTLLNLLADENEDPVALAEVELMRDRLDELFEVLSSTQYTVIVLSYGLDGEEPRSLKQISAVMGVCRERVRQIRDKALNKLRVRATRNAKSRRGEGWFG